MEQIRFDSLEELTWLSQISGWLGRCMSHSASTNNDYNIYSTI